MRPGSQTADAPSGLRGRAGHGGARRAVRPRHAAPAQGRHDAAGRRLALPVGGQGLEGCSDAQFAASSCPAGSKVGNGRIDSPLLPDPLLGGIYLATPTAAEPWRIFVITRAPWRDDQAHRPHHAGPGDGPAHDDVLRQPAAAVHAPAAAVRRRAARAASNPPGCGTLRRRSRSPSCTRCDTAVPASSTFGIGEGCGGGFAPTFTAGSASPVGGASSPFTVTSSAAPTASRSSSRST